MTTSLVFQNITFDITDRNSQPWLRGSQIGDALGYADGSAVTRIYGRHADKFTDSMTGLVNLTDPSGSEQETRIFSLRGAHLLAMLSRTKIAKAFRRWVLDLLDKEAVPAAFATEEMTRQARDAFRFGRWLMHFDTRGDMVMNPVPMEALVVDPRNAATLRSLIGEYVPFELIPEILRLANERVLMCYRANVADNKARRSAEARRVA